MHKVSIRPEIVERVVARRGRLHWFDSLDPARTALVVIDMQDTFCAPGSPAEVAVSRDIVEPINTLTRKLRPMGVPVIWVLHANTHSNGKSDWEVFFNHVVADNVRLRTIESLAPGRQKVWHGLEQGNDDITIIKNRYSALIADSRSSPSYPMQGPFGTVTRSPIGSVNLGQWENDCGAAYQNALLWHLTGNTAHANKQSSPRP